MDPFDLSLNPAISGDLFFNNNYSDELDDNDFLNFGKSNLDENFTENFDKVFNPITPDNKEDSFSEFDSSLNANNIDDFILIFQKKLNIYYFNKDFDGIINKIEKKFPYFFNEKNYGLLYIIQKLRFFELLREENVNEAKTFYQEKLLILLKEVKKQNWETKNKFFNKLIKKPSLVLKQGDLQKKYYDNFTYELDKSIRNFLAVDENNENQSKNDYLSSNNINYSSSLDFDNLKININTKKYHKSKEIINDKETNDDEKNEENNDEKNDELDIENWSTQEEFSDFEDEIQQKCSENLENKKLEENDGNHINTNQFLTENENEILGDINDPVANNNPLMREFSISSSFSKSHKNSDDIFNNFPQEDDNIDNDFIIDTSSKNNQNIINEKNNYNNNIYNNLYQNLNNEHNREISTQTKTTKNKINKKSQKNSNKKDKKKNEEIIFNQLPFLNSFKPKYIKRETIDKKIIRTFKNYVVKEYKEHRLELNNVTMDQDFFINFVNGNLLPPIDFYDSTTGEYIKFSSFNCSYLLWFFSKKGVKEIYGNFINEKGKDFINNLSDYYEINPEEKSQLNSYIFNFPFIFDISLVNNITQGTKITHLYRTVDKNKTQNENRRKKKEEERNLDLKRIKSDSIDGGRERSRSRDFDEDEDDK
jgi:hypothetical protein